MSEEVKATEEDVAYLARNMSGIPMSEWNAISNRMLATARALSAAEARAEAAEAKLAEALLNPDPWRPIEEAPKDGRRVDLWVKDYADGWFRIPDCKWSVPWPGADACWLENKPHPDALHDWEWQPIDFEPTHFRELKGPGQ